jgi:NAD(P)-dependent dehydrogenase (short-subunit alcohol dehydrogenase family)
VFGIRRVNRAALPHMRERHHGTLLYTGSTIVITTPPFLGLYSSSKAAMDQLALATAYEVSQLGIETVIVIPGAFTQATQHFPNASHASDAEVTAAYADLEPLVEATSARPAACSQIKPTTTHRRSLMRSFGSSVCPTASGLSAVSSTAPTPAWRMSTPS